MSFERLECHVIRCDECGCPGPVSPAVEAANAEALVLGWESVFGSHFCPHCSECGAPDYRFSPVEELHRD